MFVNENTNIFRKKPLISFVGKNRIITVVMAALLWIATLIVTLIYNGKELVLLTWICTSLCISAFQLLYISIAVCIEIKNRKLLLKEVAKSLIVEDLFSGIQLPSTQKKSDE